MKNLIFLITVLLIYCTASACGDFISDDFESYSVDSQLGSPWEVRTFGAITINIADTEQSPFGKAGDEQAVVYSDTATDDSVSGSFGQVFTSSTNLEASFDFKCDVSGTGVPSFLFRDAENTIAVQISFSSSGNRQIEYRDEVGTHVLESLAAGEWYHVQMSIDVGSHTFALTLQRYGEAANTYADLSFRNQVEEISQATFINNAGGNTKTTFAVDNVEIARPKTLRLVLIRSRS